MAIEEFRSPLTQYYNMQRSRSRSRSASTKRRSIARSRSVPALSMVPRGITYSGSCTLSRSCTMTIPVLKAAGFSIGAGNFAEVCLTYSPQGLKMTGDSTHFTSVSLPQYAELAAVWERVRIDKVELTILGNSASAATGADEPATTASRLIIANDWNGDAVGSAVSNAFTTQCTGAQFYNAGGDQKPIKWTIRKPKYRRLIQYTGNNDVSYEPTNGFIDTSFDVPHMGTRLAIPSVGTVGPCRIHIFAKFFLSLQGIQ